MSDTKNTKEDLGALLDAKKIESTSKFSEEKKKIYADGLTSVAESGVLENALNVGGKASDFTLKNALGKSVSLYDELKNLEDEIRYFSFNNS